ncbi:MAG: hypothetical protein ACO3A4_14845 [Silvanigrellaceae bacterium]
MVQMKPVSVFRCSLAVLVLSSAFFSNRAAGAMDRVMNSADEGSALRSAYILKMQKIDEDKKQCRKEIAEIINPQLALLDEFGQLGQAGPARGVKDELQLQADSAKLSQLQNELVRLGRLLNQSDRRNDKDYARNLRQFEIRLREFTLAHKKLESNSNSLLGKSEKAVNNFVPFANAVLKIKKQEACEDIWSDLRSSIPRNMEQMVLRNRARVKQQVAAIRGDFQNFGMVASKLILRFKTKSQVATESQIISE